MRKIAIVKTAWEERASKMIRLELARRGIPVTKLINALRKGNPGLSDASVYSKLSRGTFSASFLIEALVTLECSGTDVARLFEMSAGPGVPSPDRASAEADDGN